MQKNHNLLISVLQEFGPSWKIHQELAPTAAFEAITLPEKSQFGQFCGYFKQISP